MQTLCVLNYIFFFFLNWRQPTKSFFWRRPMNAKGFGSEQKTGRERERNRREQAGIMLDNVIKTVSPSGTNRDVSVLLMSLAFTWCSIILSLSTRLFFSSFAPSHLCFFTSRSVAPLSITADYPLPFSSCLLLLHAHLSSCYWCVSKHERDKAL